MYADIAKSGYAVMVQRMYTDIVDALIFEFCHTIIAVERKGKKMSDEIMFTFGEDGVARKYDDTWDITIHCESEEEQKLVREKLNSLSQELKNSSDGDVISRRFVELLAEYHDPELCSYKEYKGKPYFSIKYIENGEEYIGYGTYNPKVLSQYLKEYFISSAQPNLQPTCNQLATDAISRQAAIDALHTWFMDGFDEDKWWNSTHVLAAIEGLPSVHQEHKWETCFECPLSHGCPKIKGCTNEQAVEYASQIPNDCPLSAQPERKTGQWLPDTTNCYDERYICSRCGCNYKVGMYMGKPLWNFCPNCGSYNGGDSDDK